MARIAIDDELHADRRFKKLEKLLGEDLAIGLLYRFWRAAQDYWGDECALMPEREFHEDGYGPLLDVGLAEIRPEGVYACGSEQRFNWYLQICRASKLGVVARRQKMESPGQPRRPFRLTGGAVPVNREAPPGQPEMPPRSTGDAVPVNREATPGQPAMPSRSTGEGVPVNPSLLFSSLLSVKEELPSHQADAPETNSLVSLKTKTKSWDQFEKAYPDPVFLQREEQLMIAWLRGNPRKVPKSTAGWTRFIGGWLQRGWERYRKTIPSNRPLAEVLPL